MPRSHVLPDVVLDYFEVTNRRTFWELWCRGCRRGWQLDYSVADRDGEIAPGNILHLLNHAKSHKAKAA